MYVCVCVLYEKLAVVQFEGLNTFIRFNIKLLRMLPNRVMNVKPSMTIVKMMSFIT